MILSTRLMNENSYPFISSIQQICSNFPIFVIGMWAGKYIMLKKNINLLYLLLIHVVAIVIRLLFDLKILPMVIFTVCPSVLFGCYLVRWFYQLRSLFKFFGVISLESYLFNVSLPGLLICIPTIGTNIYAPYRYLLVVVIGILFSKPVHNYSKMIEQAFYNYHRN